MKIKPSSCIAFANKFVNNPNEVKLFFIENPECSQCGAEVVSYLHYSSWKGTETDYLEFYGYGKRCHNDAISDKKRFINFNNFDKEAELLAIMIS